MNTNSSNVVADRPATNVPKYKDLIYDVGMHKGEDTEFYLRKGFRVIAFEADPDLSRACAERFKDFVASGQLVIVEGAILERDALASGTRRVAFYKNSKSVWGTVHTHWAERNARLGHASNTVEVEAVDFADCIRKHGVPHYMKIDIEGCDMICVQALKTFRERPDYVSIESDKTSFAKIKQEIETLAELGYDSFQAIEQSAISSQSPPNPPREGRYVDQKFEEGSSGLFGGELNGAWKSRQDILSLYRVIRLGYYLEGDDGLMTNWKFRGAWRFRSLIRLLLSLRTKAAVPGWYDTHARHFSAIGSKI